MSRNELPRILYGQEYALCAPFSLTLPLPSLHMGIGIQLQFGIRPKLLKRIRCLPNINPRSLPGSLNCYSSIHTVRHQSNPFFFSSLRIYLVRCRDKRVTVAAASYLVAPFALFV
ncbi:hypothetical protein XENTR_v10015203 [Xenopus tropicalis]|nr:hypothetical protein XENTR_v10015203 [Xenopus tropicalis]